MNEHEARKQFEDQVLAQLRGLADRLSALETAVAKRGLDTKPNLDSIHRDIQDVHVTIKGYFSTFNRKLDVVNSELLQVKADQRAIETRVSKIETETYPQVIPQERNF